MKDSAKVINAKARLYEFEKYQQDNRKRHEEKKEEKRRRTEEKEEEEAHKKSVEATRSEYGKHGIEVEDVEGKMVTQVKTDGGY